MLGYMLNFKQFLAEGVSDMRGAWYNMKSKRAFDVSSDAGPGTNDHMGFMWASEDDSNAKKLGLKPSEIQGLKVAYESGDWDDEATTAIQAIFDRGNIRLTSYKNELAIQSKEIADKYLSAIQDAIAKATWLGTNKSTKVVWSDPIEIDQVQTDIDTLLQADHVAQLKG